MASGSGRSRRPRLGRFLGRHQPGKRGPIHCQHPAPPTLRSGSTGQREGQEAEMSAPTRRRPPDDRAKDDGAEGAVRDGNAGPAPIPAAPVLATPKRRPRRMLMAAGAILVILCALGTYWLTQRSAVGVAHDVSWGEVVTSADLVQVEVVNDPALKPVLWADVPSLVGQHAAADLQAGSLLTARSVS